MIKIFYNRNIMKSKKKKERSWNILMGFLNQGFFFWMSQELSNSKCIII